MEGYRLWFDSKSIGYYYAGQGQGVLLIVLAVPLYFMSLSCSIEQQGDNSAAGASK